MFELIVYTRDWHPLSHCSFAANNAGTKVYESIRLPDTGIEQIMWPTHCVENTKGAEFYPNLVIRSKDIIVNKGV